ncbi:glycine receptor subunit alpha-2-like [Portunus trituberculatus]|uniref:glycine receptor subunit alpha-2-like n=1 Tax=Portunus trituberculatus TaxID=210409 RepID=UPI001E1D1B14|nr:glycine receptor subunit alpha-2-like [Portunus trituberculatus]
MTATYDPDLHKFPFDMQTCELLISVHSGPGSLLLAGNLTRHPVFRERLLEYYIRNMTLEVEEPSAEGKEQKIIFTTEFGHLNGYYAISIFMPTLLLVIVSYGSFYFEDDDFTDRIMVSLTSLLVLATFISTASSTMARVSYFTFLDVWLSFCIVLVFCICMLHTFLLSLGRNSFVDEGERIEQQWAKVSPGIITLGLRETSDKRRIASPRRRRADLTIKMCVPVVIVSFTTAFFYLGHQE